MVLSMCSFDRLRCEEKKKNTSYPEYRDITSCDRPQDVYYVCLLLSVHPGSYGRRATARFHQLLSQLHGQDQAAQEEVPTYRQSHYLIIIYLFFRFCSLNGMGTEECWEAVKVV